VINVTQEPSFGFGHIFNGMDEEGDFLLGCHRAKQRCQSYTLPLTTTDGLEAALSRRNDVLELSVDIEDLPVVIRFINCGSVYFDFGRADIRIKCGDSGYDFDLHVCNSSKERSAPRKNRPEKGYSTALSVCASTVCTSGAGSSILSAKIILPSTVLLTTLSFQCEYFGLSASVRKVETPFLLMVGNRSIMSASNSFLSRLPNSRCSSTREI